MLSDRRPILLANARILDPSRDLDVNGDVLIADGQIRDTKRGIGAAGVPEGTEVFNCHGKVVALEATDVVLEPDGRAVPDSAGSIAGAVVGEILLGNPLYGDVRGAQVLNVPEGTPAASAGLLVDDVIVAVDSADVRSVDNLLLRIDRAGTQYRIRILRNGVPGWVRVNR